MGSDRDSILAQQELGAIAAVAGALYIEVEAINMADKLPNIRALPNVLNKFTQMLNDSAGKAIDEMSKAGERGQAVVGKYVAVAKEAQDTLDQVEQALEGSTNGGPLSTPKE